MLQFPPVTMRKHTLISVVAAIALLGTAACVGGSASKGEARVVVMPISGSSAASGAVSDVVESRYELVSARRYAKTARKMQAKSRAEKDIRKVSRKLDVDALVHGEFVKRGKRKYELRLSLRAGSSGAEFQSVTVKLRSKKLSQRDRSKIKKELYKALSEVDTWSQEGEDEDARASRSRRTGDSDDKERERARKLRKKKQAKEMRKDEERLARSQRKSKRSDEDDDDDDDRISRSSKSSKSDSKKSRSSKSSKSDSKKSDSKKSRSSKSSKTASNDRDSDEDRSRSKSKKSKKSKEDESYKVITVRDDDGQALDNESPF